MTKSAPAKLAGLGMKQWLGLGFAALVAAFVLLPKSGVTPVQPATPMPVLAESDMTYRWMEDARMLIAAAPAGNSVQVAQAALDASEQTCERLLLVSRMPLGEIVVTCADGERYLVFSEQTAGPVALNCTAARDLFRKELC